MITDTVRARQARGRACHVRYADNHLAVLVTTINAPTPKMQARTCVEGEGVIGDDYLPHFRFHLHSRCTLACATEGGRTPRTGGTHEDE